MRNFDLNIEHVLEHWSVAHAIREVIANALDEQVLTATAEPVIARDELGRWHVRDWGRGIRYEHLTQKENGEKLANGQRVIGKFGVGLKDAFATFHRHSIGVTLRSSHGDIAIRKERKHGFEDLSTLHAHIAAPADPTMVGTDVVLDGVTARDVEAAKGYFLRYADATLLERTPVGDVLQRAPSAGRIYVNGLLVAEEGNFLFSYNVTATTKALRQALNRERGHVGRGAYAERIKAILLACRSSVVGEALAGDVQLFGAGVMHDELAWADVAVQACRYLNSSHKVLFLTFAELAQARSFVELAVVDGHRLVTVPGKVRSKLRTALDCSGAPIRDLTRYCREWEISYPASFVPVEQLTPAEEAIWRSTPAILQLAGGRPRRVKDLQISETLRPQGHEYAEAAGAWDPQRGRIIIRRSQLSDLATYAGTLLHELIHARSGADDVSMEFEHALTETLGGLAARQLDVGAAHDISQEKRAARRNAV